MVGREVRSETLRALSTEESRRPLLPTADNATLFMGVLTNAGAHADAPPTKMASNTTACILQPTGPGLFKFGCLSFHGSY